MTLGIGGHETVVGDRAAVHRRELCAAARDDAALVDVAAGGGDAGADSLAGVERSRDAAVPVEAVERGHRRGAGALRRVARADVGDERGGESERTGGAALARDRADPRLPA